MKIYRNGTVLADVHLKDNVYMIEEVNGQHTISLSFEVLNPLELTINDYILFEGSRYKIRYKERIKKQTTSLGHDYTVVLFGEKYDLQNTEFFLSGKPERKKNFDYYTGNAKQVLQIVVDNMNRHDTGWRVGEWISTESKTFSFKDKKCGEVMDELASTYETEYWVKGKVLSLGKRKYASDGLTLGYLDGFTELELSAIDDTPPYTVIYPYGSDQNLGSDYGSDYLLLPGGLTELTKHVDKYGRIEKSVPFDHIFPKGEFMVTNVINHLTLQSNEITFDLKAQQLDGVDVYITFQTGELAGYDLYLVEGSWNNNTKQFKLKVNDRENSLKVPGDLNFKFGDKFIIYGIKMPRDPYIVNAEIQLKKEAQGWLDEHCENRVQLTGRCDNVLFKQRGISIQVGQMVHVVYDKLKIDREIRVTQVKKYIENDKPSYRYELVLSDFLQSNGFKDMVDNVNKLPNEIKNTVDRQHQYTKRSFKDVMETIDMMFDPEGNYFTEFIKPLVVHTAQLVVGTNSQQFDLIGVVFKPNYLGDANKFNSTVGTLVHTTISEDGPREWTLPASEHALDNAKAYYVYVKCARTGTEGSVLVTENVIKLEDDPYYYHFSVGILNKPDDDIRSFQITKGYTEIVGEQITSGVMKDRLSRLVIDLNNAKITAKDGAIIEGLIKFASGTTGYENIKDKPDLSKFLMEKDLDGLEFIKKAFENTTDIVGGLLLTSLLVLGVKEGDVWLQKAGINGLAKNPSDVVAWFGGTLAEAVKNLAGTIFRLDGSGQLAKGNIRFYSDGGVAIKGNVEAESIKVSDPENSNVLTVEFISNWRVVDGFKVENIVNNGKFLPGATHRHIGDLVYYEYHISEQYRAGIDPNKIVFFTQGLWANGPMFVTIKRVDSWTWYFYTADDASCNPGDIQVMMCIAPGMKFSYPFPSYESI